MSSPVNPPPDLSAYVDLRVYDVTDQEIVDTAIAALQFNLPGWVPNEGNTEVLIIESLALQMAEAIVAINRLPGAVVTAVLSLAGVDRDYGAPPVATATVSFADLLGHTVPGGTRMRLALGDGDEVTFLVEPPGLTVAPGGSSGMVSLVGESFTAAANGVAAGTPLTLVDRLPWIESVTLATTVADGRDTETDEQWRDRGVARLSRLSDALVTTSHFTAAALEEENVTAALTLDLYNSAAGSGVPGDHPGHVTVAVLGPNGTALSAPAKAALEASLEERAVAMLDVHVMDVTVVTVPVATTVVPVAGWVWADVQASVQSAVAGYLDPLAWTFGAGKIYLNEMISLVDQAPGVSRVVSLTINGVAGDYTISGVAGLPKAGTVTVTQGP